MSQTLGAHLQQLRNRAGISQADLARRLGLEGQASISGIECCRQKASAKQLAAWLDEVGATAEEKIAALDLASAPTPEAPAENP